MHSAGCCVHRWLCFVSAIRVWYAAYSWLPDCVPQLVLDKFDEHGRQAMDAATEKRRRNEEADRRRRERLERERQQEQQPPAQEAQITEITDEEAERIQREIDEKVGPGAPPRWRPSSAPLYGRPLSLNASAMSKDRWWTICIIGLASSRTVQFDASYLIHFWLVSAKVLFWSCFITVLDNWHVFYFQGTNWPNQLIISSKLEQIQRSRSL